MTTTAIFFRLHLMFCDGHLFSDPNLTVFNVHIPGRWEPTMHLVYKWGILLKTSPGGTSVKNLPANAEDEGDWDSIPGSGRSPGVGNDSPHQCSCLENFMNRGAWQAMVHGITKNWTQLWELACTRDLGKCIAKKGNSQCFKSANSKVYVYRLLISEESEKVGLKLNIQKKKMMASGPITSWEIDGETVETVSDFIFWAPKSL